MQTGRKHGSEESTPVTIRFLLSFLRKGYFVTDSRYIKIVTFLKTWKSQGILVDPEKLRNFVGISENDKHAKNVVKDLDMRTVLPDVPVLRQLGYFLILMRRKE